jgi:glycosyltransferase involved in cell wall biosynthesis
MLPLPGYPTSGAGLRAWSLGQGLRAHGFEVTFAMPAAAWRPEIPLSPEHKPLLWDRFDLEAQIRAEQPDAVIFGHWPTVQIRDRLEIPTIIDLPGPHMLERAFMGLGDPASNARAKIEALRKADYFICGGEKQKAYFIAWLLVSDLDLEKVRIDVVPVCLSPDLPAPLPHSDEVVFVYAGVYLPWQDPTLALTTVAEVLAERGSGLLRLIGGRHPFFQIEIPPVFAELEKRFQDHPHVRLESFRPYAELLAAYRQTTAAVDLMAYNYERELASTNRTVDYMWCGLPVIYNNYAELSSLIHQYEAGWVLDPADRMGLAQIVHDILDHPEIAHERGRNAQRLVRERLTWDQAVQPLVAFLRTPRRSIVHDTVAIPALGSTSPSPRRPAAPAGRNRARYLRYLLHEAWFHYRRGGLGILWQESWSFLRRQIGRP